MTKHMVKTLRERLENFLGLSGNREGELDFKGVTLPLRRSEALELVELLRGQETGLRAAGQPRLD